MDRTQSIFQPFITINYIKEQPENKLFDRKSSRVKPGDLAPIISAFADAEGGTIVIGQFLNEDINAEINLHNHLKKILQMVAE